MTVRKDQKIHEIIINIVVNHLKSRNFENIKANIDKYEKPEKISWENGNSYIPDITGEENSILNIWDVETEDSLIDEHSEDKWKAFASHASQKRSEFHIVVPKDKGHNVQKRLRDIGIVAFIHEVT